MRVVILAGGYGTRICEESQFMPKPMIEIGGKPILWHIMKQYSHFGFSDFVICAGYRQHVIKEYFANYFLNSSDVTFDFRNGTGDITINRTESEPWKVTVVDTGMDTMTGGRVKRIKDYIGGETFFLTYGDGVSDVDIGRLLDFHRKHGKAVTVMAYNPGQRFGTLSLGADGVVRSFREKAEGDGYLINAGFMVCEPRFIDYIDGDDTVLEKSPMDKAVSEEQVVAYKHGGFWQCMDTMRERQSLESLWASGAAPWKVW